MSRIAVAILAAIAPRGAWAQPFVFDGVPVPGPLTLQTHYLFYVYAAKDAPDRRHGDPTVSMELVLLPDEASRAPAPLEELARYESFGVAVLPQADFDATFHSRSFCSPRGASDASKLTVRETASGDAVVLHAISGGSMKPHEDALRRSGVYVLAAANCGNLTGFKVSGTVSVRNPHGFLPGVDYSKKDMYGLFFLVYLTISLVWIRCSHRWMGRLFMVQRSMLWVCLTAASESAAMWLFYVLWNSSNAVHQVLFFAGSLFSLWKVLLLFREALLASEVFRDDAGSAPSACNAPAHLALVAYAGAEFRFRLMAQFRTGYGLGSSEMFWNALPMVALGLLLFAWGGLSLMREKQALLDRNMGDRASLLTQSQVVVGAAAVGALATLALQLADPGLSADVGSWGLHGLISDGLGQCVFASVLAAAMLVWWPSESKQRESASAAACPECQRIGAAMDSGEDPEGDLGRASV